MSKDVEYGLIVKFPDSSHSYVHGFESGIAWNRIENGETDFSMTIHTENSEVFTRMAAAMSLSVSITDTEVEGWRVAVFSKPEKRFKIISGGITDTKEGRSNG